MRHALSRGWPFFPAKAFPVNVVPRSRIHRRFSPGRNGLRPPDRHLSKTKYPKKSTEIQELRATLRDGRKKYRKEAPSRRRMALHLAGDHIARPSVEFGD